MPLWVWLSLAFVVLVAVAGSIATTTRTLQAWRSFRSLQRASRGLDEVLRRVSETEQRLARAGDAAARLDAAVLRLRETRLRAAVLVGVLGELRGSVRRARAALPRP